MAMTPIEPEMRTTHEIAAAPLRSGETGLGYLSGISRVLCISLLVDYTERHAIYQNKRVGFIFTILIYIDAL